MDLFELVGKIVIKNDDADSKIDSVKSKAESMANTLGNKMQSVGTSMKNVGQAMMPVSAAVTGLGVAGLKVAMDFESSMSNVSAISGATGSDLEDLTAKAREMGSKTKFSASEAADAMSYMAMAGWKTSDMLSGIDGVMNLAAASGESLATTSDIVTDALTAFGLKASDSGHFADILAAASSNANTNVSMMGETFKYAAPIAGALGYSAEDTAEAIGLMANAGIKGSQAGTSLRTIMSELTSEFQISGEKLGEVTIQTTKADGTMRDFSDIIGDCRKAFKGLTEEEKVSTAETLVGKNAMSGFLALMNAGEDDINKLSSALENCDGAAEKMADTMNDNLAGQITILKSQLSELAISLADLVMPIIRSVVEKIQQAVDFLNNLDESQKKVILTIGVILAVAAPLLTTIGSVIAAIGAIMNPVTLVIGAVGGLIAILVTLYNTNETVRNVVNAVWSAIKTIFSTAVAAIKSVVTSGFHAIQSTVSSVSNAIKNVFTTAWNGIKSVSTSAISAVKSAVTSGMNAVQSSVSSVLNGIKNKFTEIWNNCTSVVSGAISKIKGLTNFSWSLPHLALPHFSISGSFSLNPPSVPHLGVEWYAKAMNEPYLFTDPTLFGYNPATGASRGAGEAGDEMMYGKRNLMNDIGTVVSAENKEIAIRLDQIARMLSTFFANNSNMQLVLDTGVLVGETAPMMNKELSKIAIQKGRGR